MSYFPDFRLIQQSISPFFTVEKMLTRETVITIGITTSAILLTYALYLKNRPKNQTPGPLPKEIQTYIVSFIQSQKEINTIKDIKRIAREIKNIALTNKEFHGLCKEDLKNLKNTYETTKIKELTNKYSAYNFVYNYYIEKEDPKGNPQLLDALFTGCSLPSATHTFSTYTSEIEEDIKEIVKLTPQSMNCILGILKCRNHITPLFAACINPKIPLHMIEFLLQQGADPKETVNVNNEPCDMLVDLNGNIDEERLIEIKKIFNKYSTA